MAEQDDASKTEEPTSKKLAKGREEGQVASSQEVKHWAMLAAVAVMLTTLAPGMSARVVDATMPFVASPHAIPFDFEHLRFVLAELFVDVGWALSPALGAFFLVAIAANLGQFGLVWAPKKLKPDVSKINVLKGFKRIFSIRGVVEFLKGILKIALVAAVAFGLSLPLMDDLRLLPAKPLTATLERVHLLAIWLTAGTVAVMTVIAILDLIYQRFTFTKSMRMTKQEVKDENKQSEGDPQIKARIRRVRMERAMQRMMAAVPEADVVVTNPTHFAVALEYKMETMTAPKVVAKGVDFMAARIRNCAEENEVPVVENPPLARALYATVELDQEIPPEHYQAVAEVIGYVMRLKGGVAIS